MSRSLSAEAVRRAADGVTAIVVLAEHSDEIIAACATAPAGTAVIAVVRRDLRFDWAWTIPEAEIGERMVMLPDGGWSVLFSPGTSGQEIRARLARLHRLAAARLAAMRNHARSS